MALVLPDWYEPAFVNGENLFIDMFSDLLPDALCGCWAPDDWADAAVIQPTLWFFRVPGGRVDWDSRKDEFELQVMAVTESRNDSWLLMDFVRTMLLPMQGDVYKMADGYKAQIHKVTEVSGPQLLTPNQRIDTRVVTANFRVAVSMKSANNYKQKLYQLWQQLRGN